MSQFVTRKGDAKEEAFFEEFYDTHNFDLLLDGSWLRRRNESEWVLKCKSDVQYRIEDIMVTLQKKFNSTGKSPDEICPNLYANFTTERYTFQEGSLWFDVSRFGEDLFYIVGTLESVESKENAGLSMHRASKIIAFIYYYYPKYFYMLQPDIDPLDLNSFESTNIFEEEEFVDPSLYLSI